MTRQIQDTRGPYNSTCPSSVHTTSFLWMLDRNGVRRERVMDVVNLLLQMHIPSSSKGIVYISPISTVKKKNDKKKRNFFLLSFQIYLYFLSYFFFLFFFFLPHFLCLSFFLCFSNFFRFPQQQRGARSEVRGSIQSHTYAQRKTSTK